MGITSDFKKRKLEESPAVIRMPENRKRLFMTKAEAMADEQRIINARKKAMELERQLLNDEDVPVMEPVEVVKPLEPEPAIVEAMEPVVESKDNPFIAKKSKRKTKQETV